MLFEDWVQGAEVLSVLLTSRLAFERFNSGHGRTVKLDGGLLAAALPLRERTCRG
jgi:hypothetical protein